MRLRWDASPWLLVPASLLAAPAAALWIGAAFQAIGFAAGGAETAVGTRVVFLLVFFGLPAVAFALAFFAFFGGELAIEDWTIDARLRLPRPPWRIVDVLAAALLVFTALLAVAVAAHGIGD